MGRHRPLHRKLAHRGSRLQLVHASESTVLRVLTGAGLHLPGAPPREPRPARPWPEWAELVPGVIWIYDFTHFTRSKRCAVAVLDVVSRYWLATVVSAEESSTQVEVAFTRALIEDGKEHLLDDDLLAELASGEIPEGDDRLPVLVALSGNGPQMTSKATAAFMAGARIAQHFGRPSTPNDQAWVESFFGHLKGEFPHLEKTRDGGELEAELDRLRITTTPSGCTKASATSPPATSTMAAAPPSAPPAAQAWTPPGPPGLPPAARYERITREPPPVAGYLPRKLVHFVGRTSVSSSPECADRLPVPPASPPCAARKPATAGNRSGSSPATRPPQSTPASASGRALRPPQADPDYLQNWRTPDVTDAIQAPVSSLRLAGMAKLGVCAVDGGLPRCARPGAGLSMRAGLKPPSAV